MTDGVHCLSDKDNHEDKKEFEKRMTAFENASNRPFFMAFRFGNNADQDILNRIVALTAGQKHDVTTSEAMVKIIQSELEKGNAFSPSKALEVFVNQYNKQIIRFFTERGIQMMKVPNCGDASTVQLRGEAYIIHAYMPPYVHSVGVQTGEGEDGEFGLRDLFGN